MTTWLLVAILGPSATGLAAGAVLVLVQSRAHAAQFRRDQYALRVQSRDALRRYDAEHGTHLADLAASPELWR